MRRALLLAGALALGGCDNMVQQARYDEYEPAPLFTDGMAMQHPPEGTVARDALLREAEQRRPELTAALVARGRERFGIYCTPCHGWDGSGDGVVPSRGFPHPPDLRSPRIREAGAAHVYEVVTQGYGVMYPYADRVEPRDRWAIAAYVQALQNLGSVEEVRDGGA